MTSQQHTDGEGYAYLALAFAGVAELILFAVLYIGYVWLAS
jgi:hypothetical protein